MAALLAVASGCAPPKGALALPTVTPTPTPVAAHGPLTITAVALHSGEVGLAYAPVTLAATGGVVPYRWSVSVGALPAGLALSPDGVISGTPSSSGLFGFSVQVFDADSDTAGLPRTIGIAPRLSASLVPACVSECSVELGCVTVCGTFGKVSGGALPLAYRLTGGTLPSGTTLSGMSLKGTFTGLPGRLSFTVQVTDGFGITASLTPTFELFSHLTLSGTVLCSGSYLSPCTATLPYSGGNPATSPKVGIVGVGAYCPYATSVCVAPGGPPGGFSVSAGDGTVTITVPAACGGTCGSGYYGAITLQLTDNDLCSSGTYCTSGTAVVDVYIQAG